MRALRFRVLGSLEVLDGERVLALGGRRLRLLLATLIEEPNVVRRRDVLMEAVWGEARPGDVEHALDNLVSRLRRELGADAVRSAAGGYVLVVGGEAVDAQRFGSLAAEGREALARGDPARAA